ASELMTRILTDDESIRMPPGDAGLSKAQQNVLQEWIRSGAAWPVGAPDLVTQPPSPIISDAAFLRRVTLDLIGLPPTAEEVRLFLADGSADKRQRAVERLLQDDRTADHWMSFWLDLLAENPTLLNASLNSTGPFRWYLYDSLRDHKPLDRLVTELMLMRGDPHEGGSAGFAIAAENDSPFAAKGHIIASAFLGIELQCARCHDSPYHSTTQKDLYSLAAMFERKPVTVPKTSRVPAAFFEKKVRQALIVATLNPDEPVNAVWPFAETTGVADDAGIDSLVHDPKDSRERLAALVTSPQNRRFSRVFVNRVWKQLIGAGLVEPVHDWEGREASHPELLDWLAQELIQHDYDVTHIVRLIVTSDLYQRDAIGSNLTAPPETRLFLAPEKRRLTAEQVVDSLHAAVGRAIDSEELTFVHDGRRPLSNRLTLGSPNRAWMFADLKNERDRPSLSLPRARMVVDVLEAFGWTGSRQKPITDRERDPNVLQPGVLANGALVAILTRLSYGSHLSDVAIQAESAEDLVDHLFLSILSRSPTEEEREQFTAVLRPGFSDRLIPADQVQFPPPLPPLPLVTWFNHLQPEANSIQQEIERRVQEGPPGDPRIRSEWRQVCEDAVWSLLNHTEFVWVP
ncbi:MAG: DUF1553 domain-containing protein, partial [Planctomycetaceae bacterium]|nr:DUF1553 domain-containing protein [Planctomycetaceae bacterium]